MREGCGLSRFVDRQFERKWGRLGQAILVGGVVVPCLVVCANKLVRCLHDACTVVSGELLQHTSVQQLLGRGRYGKAKMTTLLVCWPAPMQWTSKSRLGSTLLGEQRMDRVWACRHGHRHDTKSPAPSYAPNS